MDESDTLLLDKFSSLMKNGVNEAQAVQFFAVLSVTEYDQLIDIFDREQDIGFPETVRQKLTIILEKLRAAKRRG